MTSPGIEQQLGADPKDVARAFVVTNPELVWADTSQRGYMMIDITPQRVTGEMSLASRANAILLSCCCDTGGLSMSADA